MELLLTIAYTCLFIFIIHKMRFFNAEGLSKKMLSGIFLLKILAGTALWAVYTYYYTDRGTADIYKYFDDSKVVFDVLKTRPADYFRMLTGIGNNTPAFDAYYSQMHYWARKVDSSIYNDSHTIIRFNALVRLFSFGCYHVHTVVICFLSLTGLTAIYKTFIPHLQDKRTELLTAVFLLPSVLFWGSGVLKEGLIFFALGLLVYSAGKLFSPKAIVICLAAMLLLAFSKFYVWLAVFPGLVFLVWINKTGRSRLWLKFFTVLLLVMAIGLNIDSFTTIQNPLVTLSQKQYEFNQLAYGKLRDAGNNPIPAAGSIIRLDTLQPGFRSFLHNSPDALVNTLIRPFPSEARSPFILLAAAESWLIIAMLLLSLIFIRPLRSIRWEYVLFCLSFVLIQFLIIGETTPILGAVARYKTIALPFLLTAFLFLFDKAKFKARVSRLKKDRQLRTKF